MHDRSQSPAQADSRSSPHALPVKSDTAPPAEPEIIAPADDDYDQFTQDKTTIQETQIATEQEQAEDDDFGDDFDDFGDVAEAGEDDDDFGDFDDGFEEPEPITITTPAPPPPEPVQDPLAHLVSSIAIDKAFLSPRAHPYSFHLAKPDLRLFTNPGRYFENNLSSSPRNLPRNR